MPNTIATLCVPALYQPTRSSRKVQDEGKTKSNAEADQDDKKSGCCAGFKYKIQIQNTMAESDQNLEGYVFLSYPVYTVKLGDKEGFDKEQIGVKEPFPVTNLPFTV
jgi:hypothetical protein